MDYLSHSIRPLPQLRLDSQSCQEPEKQETLHRMRWKMEDELHIQPSPTTVRDANALGETLPGMRLSTSPSKIKRPTPNGFMLNVLHQKDTDNETRGSGSREATVSEARPHTQTSNNPCPEKPEMSPARRRVRSKSM